jgi:hypothetical protein
MKMTDITFDELRELLVDLSCSETKEKNRISFAHPALGTFLLFRPHRPKELVSARDMLVVRRQLVYNGLIEESELDAFLQKASA